ncbi:MAG: UvrD-helicase domain-containing protein [Bacteroidetes bacterium]|jgi:DNA helicase-2/ATP-dependent DNA helicase PcrA|nr:UvrD-helicase domain-containing protein [Bacteroidota bacterium]MDF1863209.1 UvrD-helicase domain-containing protein [Saprospiraceae bacterium]
MSENQNTIPTYLNQLNDIQRKAVTETEGPVLVVAGPGSGKTRVLTFRIAHLIQKGVAPWDILALTFTNKAAREMKERIEKVVGPRANRVWAGTFHSIFARILRVEAEKIGYPSNFTIYDSDDTKSVISAIIKEMNLNKEHYNTNAIRSRISSAKSNLITPKLYENDPQLMAEDQMAKRPYVQKIYTKYVARCKRAGAMDFDDLLFRLFELLQKHEDVRKKYQERFKYILVDEFQDTNHLQYSIVKKLVNGENKPRNICVVGDDAQSIYAFRGATIQNILDFEKDYKPHGIQVFKLEQNYRSTEHIVKAANEVITHNRNQIQKTIWSDKGSGSQIKVIKTMSDTEEGKRVADTIVEQKTRHHLSNKEIAILYRTNAQSRVFEEYLRRYNIHYKVFGGLSFYQRKEVKDLIAYLRLVINPKDEEALRRVINFPRRGIGKTTIEKISALADAKSMTMWEVMIHVQASTKARNSIAGFKAMIELFQKKAETGNAYEVAIMAAKQSKLVDLLKQDTTIEGINRLENVNALLDGIKEFTEDNTIQVDENSNDKSLTAYLQNIALLTDQDEKSNSEDYVTLMSVHAAKGLEFKSVFVVGMEEQLFPSFMALKSDSPDGLDEERRLFYVAITRAEAFLTLSYAASRYKFGKQQYNEPSRFLDEIDISHLDNNSAYGRSSRAQMGNYGRESKPAAPSRAGVSGNFKRTGTAVTPSLKVDPKTFKPSPSQNIQNGMRVLHMRFGEGKVMAIDGINDKRVATIFFKSLPDDQQKRIMLKFAKLQILN